MHVIFGQLSEIGAGKLLLVYMDDDLAIITLSSGACLNLSPLVHDVETGWMDGWENG